MCIFELSLRLFLYDVCIMYKCMMYAICIVYCIIVSLDLWKVLVDCLFICQL